MGWLGSATGPVDAVRERNAAELARRVFQTVVLCARDHRQVSVDSSLLLSLHQIGMRDELTAAGSLRIREVEISGSSHEPPPASIVPALVEECCAYLNSDLPPLHLAAYALWRVAWIHQFDDGNGRIARALAYLLFFSREQLVPPGRGATLPERILRRRLSYQRLLGEADLAWKKNRKIAMTNIEGFLGALIRAEMTDR